jgi:aspartate aminotransferase
MAIDRPGSKPLLYTLFQALGGPVALPKPSWVSYAAQTSLLGIRTTHVATPPGQGGVPDPDLLEAEAQRLAVAGTPLAAVLVTIPDNPTGTIAGQDTVRRLCTVAERHDLVVISDEIYGDLVHDGSTALTPSILVPDRTITTTGLSKNLALGGWRLGVARFPTGDRFRRLQDAVKAAASEIWSAPANPVQHVAAWAFTEPGVLRSRIEASRLLHGRVARAVADCFREYGAQVPSPTAGFYVYPSFGELPARSRITTSETLAQTLLHEHGIATLAGTAFGDDPGKLSLRVATSMLYGTEPGQREQALLSDTPASLPWVQRDLMTLRRALAGVTSVEA